MLSIRRLSVLMLGGLLSLSMLLIVGNFGPSWVDDSGPPVVNADGKIDVVDVTDHFPSVPPVVFGTSQLLRTHEGIAFTLNTTGLEAGNGYTLWMFIDESDASLGGPPGLEAFEIRIQMGGEFAAADGSAQFSSFLPAGAIPAATGPIVLATDDGFLSDPIY